MTKGDRKKLMLGRECWERKVFPHWIFDPGNEEYRRIAQISYGTIFIAIIVLVAYAVPEISQGDTIHGLVMLIFAAALVLVILCHRRTEGHSNYPAAAGVLIFGFYCLYLIFYGAGGNTTFVWVYSFPLVAMFITGSYRGGIAVTLVFLPMIFFLIFDGYISSPAHYSMNMKLRFIPSLLVISILSYIYERNIERAQQRLNLTLAELGRSKEDIQQQVKDRTFQLQKANENLLQEIQERKQAEEALRDSEERFSRAFNMSPYPTVISALDTGMFIDVNDSFLYMSGYAREEIIGRTAFELSIWTNRDDRKYLALKLIEQGFLHEEPVHLLTKVGKVRDLLMSSEIVPLTGEKNVLSIFHDITDQKKLEDHLRQVQKLEAIGTLAGGIAHDFNNILSAVMGYTEMALGEPNIGGCLRGYLENINKAGERASYLVKQILAFSRRQAPERKPVLIAPVIEEGIKMLRSSLHSTIQITQSIVQVPTMILADSTQIHQVLMNLCTNAAHAMRESGGILDIHLTRERVDLARELHPFNLGAGDYVKLTVSDTGCGIAVSVMGKIFDPFFTTKGQGEGTGLGLSIVYGIVRDQGGAIEIASEPKKGTTFSVYFPIEDMKEPLPEHTREHVSGGSERILFVDDEEVLVELGNLMLTSIGYRVTPKTNSIEALKAFSAAPNAFDLVITDMTMPYMRGDNLALEFLKLRPDIPIILCTGFNDLISEEKAKSLGIRRFITKPFFKKDLALVIRDVLDN